MSKAILKEIPLEELRKENYFYKWYHHFISSLALYGRTPFQVSLYKSGAKRQTMIIFMEDSNGNTYSRKISGNVADMTFLRSWLTNDFDDLEFEFVNHPEAEQMLVENGKQYHRDD